MTYREALTIAIDCVNDSETLSADDHSEVIDLLLRLREDSD